MIEVNEKPRPSVSPPSFTSSSGRRVNTDNVPPPKPDTSGSTPVTVREGDFGRKIVPILIAIIALIVMFILSRG